MTIGIDRKTRSRLEKLAKASFDLISRYFVGTSGNILEA
jgi:hypothetical protein